MSLCGLFIYEKRSIHGGGGPVKFAHCIRLLYTACADAVIAAAREYLA